MDICDGTNIIRSPGTILTSPGYRIWNYDNYPSNQNCEKVVQFVTGMSVRIEFRNPFDLEYNSRCNSDFVEIRDGTDESSPLLLKECGVTRPHTINSLGSSV